MDISSFSLVRICTDYAIKPFDCDDKDLNEFLLNDSIVQYGHLFNVTYLLEDVENNKTAGFYSLLNDKIIATESKSLSFWRKGVGEKIPHFKRKPSYPAMKIGRLGIHHEYQKQGLGSQILDYIKILFVTNNRTGCRFITVDAYKQSLEFYERNGFAFLTDKDANSDTRLMFYDLMRITPI
jgi:GNAT superfamily N-acetyltransferase